MKKRVFGIVLLLLVTTTDVFTSMQKLRISPNKRFLVKQDGSAFEWIGATM